MIGFDEIDKVLADLRVFSLDPNKRRELTAYLATNNISTKAIKSVFAEVRVSCQTEEQARGLFVSIARQAERFRSIYDNVCDVDARKRANRIGGDPSDAIFASATNPYGWQETDIMRPLDNSAPGAWNPYRQCYNFTAEEMVERGIKDPRPKGCTRSDALGQFDPQRVKDGADIMPAPEWAPSTPTPQQPEQPERDIYR